MRPKRFSDSRSETADATDLRGRGAPTFKAPRTAWSRHGFGAAEAGLQADWLDFSDVLGLLQFSFDGI